MVDKILPSQRAATELSKLGADIVIARKRRQFTQQRLADGAGISRATVGKIEAGDPGVSMGALAMVLLTLGESGRLSSLLDVSKDDIGLAMGVNALPQRVRTKRRKPAASASPAADGRAIVYKHGGDPEVF